MPVQVHGGEQQLGSASGGAHDQVEGVGGGIAGASQRPLLGQHGDAHRARASAARP